MRVIQIRGTSGCGKSWVMKRVMELTPGWLPVVNEGKRRPIGYHHPDGMYVVGHYETACGGGDSIGSAPAIYQAIQAAKAAYSPTTVLVEALLLSEDVRWTSKLAADRAEYVKVLFLTTDVERCVAQIKSRRAEAGNDKPLNEENTRGRVDVIERARLKLLAVPGVDVVRASSNQASGIILKWLRTRPEAV